MNKNPHRLLSSFDLNQIEKQAKQLAEVGFPAWGETVQLLINNIRNDRIALAAAVEDIGLKLD